MAKVNHLKTEDLQEWANEIVVDGAKVYIAQDEEEKATHLLVTNGKDTIIFPMEAGRRISNSCLQ